MTDRGTNVLVAVVVACALGAVYAARAAQPPAQRPVQPAGGQRAVGAVRPIDPEEYTRYELLAPESAQFKIVYEVVARRAGDRFFFNPIRKGSVASDEAVYDQASGQPLKFQTASGADARTAGMKNADLEMDYIKIELPRPVPANGEVRLRIDKTYKDAKSYYREDGLIVFDRSLGIRKNAVVLPAGYELVSCNYPSQVLSEADGRIAVSFINVGPGEVPLVVKARRLDGGGR